MGEWRERPSVLASITDLHRVYQRAHGPSGVSALSRLLVATFSKRGLALSVRAPILV